MIISEKWKYIFVGLPFSASSAITKELVECYEGHPVSWKHSNVTELIFEGKDISKYYVFAVYRNPIDIEFTYYNKLVTNAHDIYTDPKFFRENGGWLSRRERYVFNEVKRRNLDFNAFLRFKHKIPYDSVFSLNRPFLNKILDFDDLNNSFQIALRDIGINANRDLPIFNKTDKPAHLERGVETSVLKIFSPFLYYNHIPGSDKPSLYDGMLYRMLQPARFWKWKRFDLAMHNRTINDYDYLEN